VTLELFLATALSFLQGLVFIIGYISNNAFPQPLSEKDEAIYLQRMENGDEEARNILAEHNLRLVAHIIKKFDFTGEDPDDLISIGTIGLIKAINTFNSKKGTKLATYAARCIENEIAITITCGKLWKSFGLLPDLICFKHNCYRNTIHTFFRLARFWPSGNNNLRYHRPDQLSFLLKS
jgi:RNA polymerase sporulation-specific sigma factor